MPWSTPLCVWNLVGVTAYAMQWPSLTHDLWTVSHDAFQVAPVANANVFIINGAHVPEKVPRSPGRAEPNSPFEPGDTMPMSWIWSSSLPTSPESPPVRCKIAVAIRSYSLGTDRHTPTMAAPMRGRVSLSPGTLVPEHRCGSVLVNSHCSTSNIIWTFRQQEVRAGTPDCDLPHTFGVQRLRSS